MTRQNAYKLLDLPSTCTDETIIKNAFKKLAMKHHPDKGGNEENFKKLLEAKEVLLSKEKLYTTSDGNKYTEAEYSELIKEFIKKSHDDLNRYEASMSKLRKITFIRLAATGLFLLKWLVFAAIGLSSPIISLVSLAIYGLVMYQAPRLARIHDKYLK